jgi:DNA repair protein RadC
MTVKLHKAQKIKILNSLDIATIMQTILLRETKIDRNKEHLWLVALDAENRIMMIELVSLGSNRQTIAEPMEIFSFALQKQASKIILVHNHPSGNVTPSPGDRGLTEQMMAIGKFIRLPVVDHLIISENSHFSFLDSGLYSEIEHDTLFDLSFGKLRNLIAEKEEGIKFGQAMQEKAEELRAEIEKERISTQLRIYEAEQKIREVTEKQQKYAIALKARSKGMNLLEVSELTGLSDTEISELESRGLPTPGEPR